MDYYFFVKSNPLGRSYLWTFWVLGRNWHSLCEEENVHI